MTLRGGSLRLLSLHYMIFTVVSGYLLVAEEVDTLMQEIPIEDQDSLEKEEALRHVNQLPNKLRHPLILAIRGYSYQEIAEILNLTLSTVKSRVFKRENK